MVREHEAQRPDDVRGVAQQHLALLEGVAHKAQFALLQITQPAVNQLRAGRRGVRGQVVLLAQQDVELSPCASRAIPAPLMPPPMTSRSIMPARSPSHPSEHGDPVDDRDAERGHTGGPARPSHARWMNALPSREMNSRSPTRRVRSRGCRDAARHPGFAVPRSSC